VVDDEDAVVEDDGAVVEDDSVVDGNVDAGGEGVVVVDAGGGVVDEGGSGSVEVDVGLLGEAVESRCVGVGVGLQILNDDEK
jgi:hypothetical protein